MPKKSFEQNLARLEEIAAAIENPETALEQSIKLFKEGLELSVLCGKTLNDAEKEITQLYETAMGTINERAFE